MRYLLACLLILAGVFAYGQSVVPLRGDTIKIYKVGGYAELVVQNRTKDSLGLMINAGNGRTEFRRAKMLDATHIIIGLDTLVLSGGGSGPDTLFGRDDITAHENRSFNASLHDFLIDSARTYSLASISGDTSAVTSANAASAQMITSISDSKGRSCL